MDKPLLKMSVDTTVEYNMVAMAKHPFQFQTGLYS